jgi:hypothetical protein
MVAAARGRVAVTLQQAARSSPKRSFLAGISLHGDFECEQSFRADGVLLVS